MEITINSTIESSELIFRQDSFLDNLPVDDIALAVGGEDNREIILAMLDTYANESRISLGLVVEELRVDMRILEVGAGLCLTSLFLKAEGYQVTSLEPAIGGFEVFEQVKDRVLENYSELNLKVISDPAQSLDVESHGLFDLIFSNNVLEHIPQWQKALSAMTSVLSEQGKMIHACPNYSVPYEPHYGVPVFRRLPALSRRLFLASDKNPEIWNSLNFITSKNIRDYCNRNSLSYFFEKELLYKALQRINDDPMFRKRHQGVIAVVASLLMRSGLGKLFRFIPPAVATPMIVKISKHSGYL